MEQRPSQPAVHSDSDPGNAVCIDARRRAERSATAAVILVGIGILVALGPTVPVGRSFVILHSVANLAETPEISIRTASDGISLWHLARGDLRWAAAALMIAAPPLWFWWWRRSRMAYGAALGFAVSVAAAAAVFFAVAQTRATFQPIIAFRVEYVIGSEHVERGGTWWTLLLAHALFATAFLVAPPPRDPEAVNDLLVKSLVRRHRKNV